MKVLVLGIEGARPGDLFEQDGLENLRRLMEFGCYGRLEPLPAGSPENAWHGLAQGSATGPGHRSYNPLWEHLESLGSAVTLIGVSPELWIPESGGISIESTIALPAGGPPQVHPAELANEVHAILQGSPTIDPQDPSAGDALQRVLSQSRQQFSLVRRLLQDHPWSYFQHVDCGLKMLLGQATPEDRAALAESYCLHIDREVGALFELLGEETVILVVGMPAPGAPAAHSENGQGSFILASANNPLNGELEGVALADLAPTLLALSGLDIPSEIDGKSIFSGIKTDTTSQTELSVDDEEILRERLSGLGYIE